jgi:hypothetical protein
MIGKYRTPEPHPSLYCAFRLFKETVSFVPFSCLGNSHYLVAAAWREQESYQELGEKLGLEELLLPALSPEVTFCSHT